MATIIMSSSPATGPVATGIKAKATRIMAPLGRFPLAIHQLLFRLAIAGVFLKAGLVKVSSWQTTVALFRDEYKVPVLPPEIAATLASCFELGCSTLLVLGLASRLATLPLLAMIVTVQLFVYPDAWSEHLIWASILLFLFTRGPGAISLDRAIGLERRD
jgi:putative oxidoreductase